MRLLAAIILVSFSAYLGYRLGREQNALDASWFDAQAHIIRSLSRQLDEATRGTHIED